MGRTVPPSLVPSRFLLMRRFPDGCRAVLCFGRWLLDDDSSLSAFVAVIGAVAFFAATFSAAAFGARMIRPTTKSRRNCRGSWRVIRSRQANRRYFVGTKAAPTFLLNNFWGETADPRLPPFGWHVQWDGVIQILHPGKYRFSAIHSGPLKIVLNGKTVFDEAEAAKEPTPAAAVELAFGVVPIQIQFEAKPTTTLKIYWQSETMAREPLPSQALGHTKQAPPIVDSFFNGRLTVEEHSCVACHRAERRREFVEADHYSARPAVDRRRRADECRLDLSMARQSASHAAGSRDAAAVCRR